MEAILQGVLELAGVTAAMVFDGEGQLVAHRAHAVHDRALCAQIGGPLSRAIDSVQLQQEDWETIVAQFTDGKLILRNLVRAGEGLKYVLVVVADATLNASFATVAIRVAANKLKKAIAGGDAAPGRGSGIQAPLARKVSGIQPPPIPSTIQPPPRGSGSLPTGLSSSSVTAGSSARPEDSRPALANSGLSWSKTSSIGISGVAVADPASAALLTRCAKELARHVGPIAKVYVQEAVRRVCAEAPFSLSVGPQLVEDLAGQIEEPKDQAQFRKVLADVRPERNGSTP